MRNENTELQDKIQSLNKDAVDYRLNRESEHAKVMEEKAQLQNALDELESKIKQIEDECALIDQQHKDSVMKNEEYQKDLHKRDETILQLKEEIKFIQDEK